jgi:hypothetical protein
VISRSLCNKNENFQFPLAFLAFVALDEFFKQKLALFGKN